MQPRPREPTTNSAAPARLRGEPVRRVAADELGRDAHGGKPHTPLRERAIERAAFDPDHDLGSRRAGGDLVERGDHHHRTLGVCGDRDTDRAARARRTPLWPRLPSTIRPARWPRIAGTGPPNTRRVVTSTSGAMSWARRDASWRTSDVPVLGTSEGTGPSGPEKLAFPRW